MTYSHLLADCLYTWINSGPNTQQRVWEAFTFFTCSKIYIIIFDIVIGYDNNTGIKKAV